MEDPKVNPNKVINTYIFYLNDIIEVLELANGAFIRVGYRQNGAKYFHIITKAEFEGYCASNKLK